MFHVRQSSSAKLATLAGVHDLCSLCSIKAFGSEGATWVEVVEHVLDDCFAKPHRIDSCHCCPVDSLVLSLKRYMGNTSMAVAPSKSRTKFAVGFYAGGLEDGLPVFIACSKSTLICSLGFAVSWHVLVLRHHTVTPYG